jgi:hypothetical protein
MAAKYFIKSIYLSIYLTKLWQARELVILFQLIITSCFAESRTHWQFTLYHGNRMRGRYGMVDKIDRSK